MNCNFVQINNHLGAVSDENGEIKIISKENNDNNFEDILRSENEIDNKKEELALKTNELKSREIKVVHMELLNLCVLIGEIIIYVSTHLKVDINILLFTMLFYYSLGKGLILIGYGTRKSNYRKIKELKTTIEELKEKIPELKKQLEYLKQKVKYNEKFNTKNESKTNSYIAAFNYLSDYMEENKNEEINNCRVLKIGR